MAIRLATEETKTISDTIYGFDKNAAIFLFGSITDESKKGGDIDLLIISGKILFVHTYYSHSNFSSLFFIFFVFNSKKLYHNI